MYQRQDRFRKRSAKRETSRVAGFTLLEILIVLAVIAVLGTIGFTNLTGFRKNLDLEGVASQLSQDMQTARSEAVARGNDWRIKVNNKKKYVIQERVNDSWQTEKVRKLSGDTELANVSSGDKIIFDSRSYTTHKPSDLELQVTNGEKTLRVITSMIGNVRIE